MCVLIRLIHLIFYENSFLNAIYLSVTLWGRYFLEEYNFEYEFIDTCVGNLVEYEQRLTHLQTTLQDMYLQEPLYASCLMIQTLGTNSPLTTHLQGTSLGLIEKDKLSACVETICKCLKNILEHPNEDKYRSIRCGSKALKEKVLPVTGTELFLSAVGFVQEHRDFQGNEELFYVLDIPAERENIVAKADIVVIDSQDDGSKQSDVVAILPMKQINNEADVVADSQDDASKQSGDVMISSDEQVISKPDVVMDELTKQLEHLSTALELLTSVSPVKLALNRDVRVYKASASVNRFPELPSSFFILKPEEVKKESESKREQVEMNEMLLTRAQRDKLDQQATRQYQFCVIRIRLPEGLILQATFRAKEKLSDLFYFISQSLGNEAMLFSLFHQGGKKLENMNLSLQEAELVPAALVNLRIDLGTHTGGILKSGLMRKIEIIN